MTVRFGDIVVQSYQSVKLENEEDELAFNRFATFLLEAKEKAVVGGLAEWKKFLSQPEVKEAERAVLESRSVKDYPFVLDKTADEGRPHDYVLYRDYVWTLDEDHLRFEGWQSTLVKERLDREWQKIELPAESRSASAFERSSIPEAVRHQVWRRDRGQCSRCGSRERLEFDHIVPLAMGGGNTARNIELLCESCNRRKGGSLSVR